MSRVPALLLAATLLAPLHSQAPRRKRVLAWADTITAYQHDSITHALATMERLGRESGSFETYIRTDSQLITKHPIVFPAGTGIATGEQFNVRNLNDFDAIFFFGVREIDLSPDQRADLLSFIRDDGKGFVAAHSAATAFFSWPEFGDMLGGRFDACSIPSSDTRPTTGTTHRCERCTSKRSAGRSASSTATRPPGNPNAQPTGGR